MPAIKDFNTVQKEVKVEVYSNASTSLVVLSKMNTAVDFTEVLAPNGATDGTTSKYNVHRKKRPSVNVVANPNAGTTASALAALDQFGKEDWETLHVATGVLRSVGITKTLNDNKDITDFDKHRDAIKQQEGEIAITRKNDIFKLITDNATTATTTGQVYAKGETNVWTACAKLGLEIAAVDDEFLPEQDPESFILLMNQAQSLDLTNEMGTVFTNEKPIAETGFKSNMSVNDMPVIISSKIPVGTIIAIHKNSIAFRSNEIAKPVNIDLGLVEKQGKFFYDVMAVIDPARILKVVLA